jgi:hypothetical protein
MYPLDSATRQAEPAELKVENNISEAQIASLTNEMQVKNSASDSADADESEEEIEPEDKIFAEFMNIKRTKLKFKCEFRNAMLHLRGRDYVIKSLVGDIDY